MLRLEIPPSEFWNEETSEFEYTKPMTIEMEHSLIAMSKWESKWKKPFLGDGKRDESETIDYYRCMTITRNVDPKVYLNFTNEAHQTIADYISDSMTATTFVDLADNKKSRKVITSEVIYYWMIAHTIPLDCEKWHLNRLLTLIRVCSEMSQPDKKQSRAEVAARQRQLNAQRRAAWGTKG